MLGRIVVAHAVLAFAAPAASAQGGYVEPPPSPPREAAPATAAPVEPAAAAPVEKPSTAPAEKPSTSTSASAPASAPAYEPYSPPGMTWAPPPGGQGGQDPTSASTTQAIRAAELGVGALAAKGGGMAEVSLLADLGRWALGGVVTFGGVNEHLGVGVHLAGGPRFALGSARLELQVDAGLVIFGDDGEEARLTGYGETSGSEEVLPAIGVRLGVTFQGAASGRFLSVGVGIRRVQRTTASYTVTDCKLLSACVTTPATAEYGGTIAGGYLTIGRSYARGR